MENSIFRNLPEELVVEILLRLPVKTLSRFKCVSVEWDGLIRSSSFVNQHFAHERNQERLFVQHYKPKKKHAVAFYIDDDLISRYEEPEHLLIPTTMGDIMGPSNGVFCVTNVFGKIACLNPAMREFRLLPDLVHSSYTEPHFSIDQHEFGFGLDSFGNFKVVLIKYFHGEEWHEPSYPCIISVYNSGSDSWRHFKEVDFVNSKREIRRSLVSTYLNEVYYWLMRIRHNDCIYVLAFDMRSETFREIKGPNGAGWPLSELCSYGDSLALLHHDYQKFVDVGVMESDGHWSKFFKVEDLGFPLGFWKTSELLLTTETSEFLSMYNINAKTLRALEDHQSGRFMSLAFIYKESLVSIKGEGDKCYLWDTNSDVVKNFFFHTEKGTNVICGIPILML